MEKFRCTTLVITLLVTGCVAASSAINLDSTSTVSIELGEHFGEFTLINHGQALCLKTTVVVEQKTEKQWKSIPVSNLKLRSECRAQPEPDHIELGAKSILHPVAWTGRYCSSQCPSSCRLDGEVSAGTYRFVISTCDGRQTFVSPSFEKIR